MADKWSRSALPDTADKWSRAPNFPERVRENIDSSYDPLSLLTTHVILPLFGEYSPLTKRIFGEQTGAGPRAADVAIKLSPLLAGFGAGSVASMGLRRILPELATSILGDIGVGAASG